MNKEKTNLQKVKDFFANTPELENLEVVEKETKEVKDKFEEVTLVDGTTILNINPAIEPDATVTVMVEGEEAPAPVGEWELTDGRIIVIEVEGIVAEVKEVTEEEIPVEDAPVDEELNKDTEATQKVRKVIESIVKESVFELTEKFKKENEFLHKENDALKVMFAELKENTGIALKEVFETPSKEPVKKQKNVFKKEDKNIFIKNKKNN
tara:strand:+ start:1624 stop:2250 length:627 start_codon:yes stop_codon:yes gene_type:complete